jgi:hypothetical protein
MAGAPEAGCAPSDAVGQFDLPDAEALPVAWVLSAPAWSIDDLKKLSPSPSVTRRWQIGMQL